MRNIITRNGRHACRIALFGAACAAGLVQADSSTPSATIIYRVYLPSGGEDAVTLPTLEFSYSDGRPTVAVPACARMVQGMAAYVAGNAVPSCAWELKTDGLDPLTNIAYPDTGSVYWTTQFAPDPALTITVHGSFPAARYMSVNVYDGTHSSFTRNGVASGLADFRIAADAGAANPWQQPAAAGGGFTLRVREDVASTDSNVLPMPPAASSGGLGLPSPCSGTDCPPLLQFLRPSDISGLSANVDNAYLAALFQPQPGYVLVVRGKAPSAPSGYYARHPEPWPAPVDMRYWSLCNNEYRLPYPVVVNRNLDGSVDTGCRADDEMPRDTAGFYTVVVSAPADRPSNAVTTRGIAWLPDSATNPSGRHMLLLRNMLSLGFPQAIQNVPQDDNPASAGAVMQDYYPRIYQCTRLRFELSGWQGCAAH